MHIIEEQFITYKVKKVWVINVISQYFDWFKHNKKINEWIILWGMVSKLPPFYPKLYKTPRYHNLFVVRI